MPYGRQFITGGDAQRPPLQLRGSRAGRRVRAGISPNALAMATLGTMSLLFCVSTASARPVVNSPQSPFATIPAHLKTLTKTEQEPIRPLLIFQIGEGGSAATVDTMTIDGQRYREARVYLAKRLLKRYTKKYGNKIQWSLYIDSRHVNQYHVYNCLDRWKRDQCSPKSPLIAKMFSHWDRMDSGRKGDFKNISNVRIASKFLKEGSRINQWTGVWGDHSTFIQGLDSMVANSRQPFRPLSLNYVVQPVFLIKQNLRYRCQPSYYVVVDDGYQYGPMNGEMNRTSENALYGLMELAKNGEMPYKWSNLQFKHYNDITTGGSRKHKNKKPVFSYDYACITKFGTNAMRWSKKWLSSTPPSDGSCGMRFFSYSLAHEDLMKDEDLRGSRPTDDAGKSWDDPEFPTQSMETFAIRINTDPMDDFGDFSEQENSAQAYYRMKGMASRDEYFYDVKNGEQFKAAFDSIIATVASSIKYGKVQSYATVSPALGAPGATPVPGSAANVRLNLFEGSSEIRFHKVKAEADDEKYKHVFDNEDNKAGVDNAAAYKIDIDLDNYSRPLFSERVPLFSWRGETHSMNTVSNLGMSNRNFHIDRNWSDEWKEGLLSWLGRTKPDSTIKNDPDFALDYRERKVDADFDNLNMGDIIDTPVLDIGNYLTAAANDGLVYVFKKIDAGGDKQFSLKMNFVPMDIVRESDDDRLKDHYHLLPDPEYAQTPNKPHQFMINGGMVWRLTAPNGKGNRNLIVAGGFGQGGRGAYVLRIAGNSLKDGKAIGIEANRTDWNRSVPLFTVNAESGSGERGLGYTFGDPQIGQLVKTRRWEQDADGNFLTKFNSDHYLYALFLSSGFNNPSQGADATESALYVYNIFDYQFGSGAEDLHHEDDAGARLAKIVAPDSGGGLAPATLVDVDNDGIVDLAYAGDYNGGLYRFDFTSGIAKAAAVKIFQAPAGQHFTSAPGIMKVVEKDKDTGRDKAVTKMMVVIGTGSDIYESDAEDTGRNSIYGVRDDLTRRNPSVLTYDDLLLQTFNESQGTTKDKRKIDVKTRVGTSVEDLNGKFGWYVNLSEGTGERVVTKPLVYDGMALFGTRMYAVEKSSSNNSGSEKKDPCVVKKSTQKLTGSGWIMQFDALTGSMPREFDYKKDNRQAAYIDFFGHLDDKNKPIVSGVMEPESGIPNFTMSGSQAVLDGLSVMKDANENQTMPLDANFEGDIGGSGVSGELPKLSKLNKGSERDYNHSEMKYDRGRIVPALFVSTSERGLQPPYSLAIKRIKVPKKNPPPAGQTQILKRLSYKVFD